MCGRSVATARNTQSTTAATPYWQQQVVAATHTTSAPHQVGAHHRHHICMSRLCGALYVQVVWCTALSRWCAVYIRLCAFYIEVVWCSTQCQSMVCRGCVMHGMKVADLVMRW